MSHALNLAPFDIALANVNAVRQAPQVTTNGSRGESRPAFPEVIDSTIRKSFSSCEQLWWLSHIEHLSSMAPSIHLHAGAVFAKGIETFRREFYLLGHTRDEAVELADIAMVLEWANPDGLPMFSWHDAPVPKTLDALIAALDYYVEMWPPETDAVQPLIADGRIGVEFSFAIPIPEVYHPTTGQNLLYAGRFDMLGVYDGLLWPVDEKTTSRLGDRWASQWDMRSQFTGYCWAARAFGYDVAGVIVRGVSFLKRGFGSAQAITFREDWKINRWLETLQGNTTKMIEVWKSGNPVLNLDESCNAYGRCPFVDVCNTPNPQPIKDTYYVRREWNPLSKV